MSEACIYLDYMATTPVDERVAEAMSACMTLNGSFGNPASTHHYGLKAKKRVAQASAQVAHAIGAEPELITFTSGATESINLALKGAAHFYQRQGRHLVTSQLEHPAVLNTMAQLEKEGFSVTYLPPDAQGLIQPEAVKNALRPDTILVSLMHVNNEIGVVTDIESIGPIVRSHGALLHVDAAQSVGKLPVDVERMHVDLLSLSAHKAYGPKGIGALYRRRQPRVQLVPLLHGGGTLRLRPGTLPVHQIVGMGEAFHWATLLREEEYQRISQLSARLWAVVSRWPGVVLNGDAVQRVPHNLNLRFEGIDNRALMRAVPQLAISAGSACRASGSESSTVLKALGLTQKEMGSTVRISLGRYTTEKALEEAINLLKIQVQSAY